MANDNSRSMKMHSSNSSSIVSIDIPYIQHQLTCFNEAYDRLKVCKLNKDTIQVSFTQTMKWYISVEDKLLDLIYISSKYATSQVEQQLILQVLEKYNKFGADFQDSWNEDTWNMYETLREQTTEDFRSKQKLDYDGSQVQVTVATTADELEDYQPYLRTVDSEAIKYRTESIKQDIRIEKSCNNCCIF